MYISVIDWVYSVLASAAGAAALIATAVYLGRAQLSHWLSKDLETQKAQFQRDLEAQKAQHQRDLESYKVSLIAETERAKASQDVRKAMAIKIAEKRFNAIDGLHRALSHMNISTVHGTVLAYAKQNQTVRSGQAVTVSKGIAEMARQVDLASPFLGFEEVSKFRIYLSFLNSFLEPFVEANLAIDQKSFEEKAEPGMVMHVECAQIVATHIAGLFAME